MIKIQIISGIFIMVSAVADVIKIHALMVKIKLYRSSTLQIAESK